MGDMINHPTHYNAYAGLEVIDLVEQMNFNRGNAVKYIARAGFKSAQTEVQDLRKAAWYIDREINRIIPPGEKKSNDPYEGRIDTFDKIFWMLHNELGIPNEQVREIMNFVMEMEQKHRGK